MTEIEIHNDIFNEAYVPYLDNLARTQIFYGGAASGKSVFLAQRCVIDVLKGGRNYLVCRAIGRTIRRSVFNEIRKVIADWGVTELFELHKADAIITCTNGYQIVFAGLDDPEKLKSITPERGAITDIWVEEATECDRDTIKNLYKRQRGGDEGTLKRLTMSFNPLFKTHWIYTDYFSRIAWTDEQTDYSTPELSILRTWHVHNKFLTHQDRFDLENEKDKYFYSVYTRGEWGILGNVIFTNWEMRDLADMRDQFTNRRHGLDFGFSADPAALWVSHYDKKKKTIYVYDELYEAGLTNDMLADEVLKIIEHDLVTCDSSEPKSIVELRGRGINAKGAHKGKDSVSYGIQWLQQQHIVIDIHCINARNEFAQYKWKEDRNGVAIRQPVDRDNHMIDAGRYAYEDDMEGGSWSRGPGK